MDISEYNAIFPLIAAGIYTIILVVLILRRKKSPVFV